MPVKTVKKGSKFRVVESSTGKIVKNKKGTSIDGGGHSTRDKAVKQVQAVNLSERRRKGA